MQHDERVKMIKNVNRFSATLKSVAIYEARFKSKVTLFKALKNR